MNHQQPTRRDYLAQSARRDDEYPQIRPEVIESIRWYADGHCGTGGFLHAVLANDLRTAVNRADEDNLAALHHIVRYCFWEIPTQCWGSYERVREWLAKEGDDGQ